MVNAQHCAHTVVVAFFSLRGAVGVSSSSLWAPNEHRTYDVIATTIIATMRRTAVWTAKGGRLQLLQTGLQREADSLSDNAHVPM